MDKLESSHFTKEEALNIHYIFTNGVAFNDCFVPIAWRGKPYLTRYYQFPIVIAEEAVIIGGRSWGKSITLEAAVVKAMLRGRGVQSVLTSFRKLHIRDREEKIINYFENVPYFKMFLMGKNHTIRDSVNRSPIYTIKLMNGHIHYGISIGDDPLAINIQGTHPSYRFGEEFQFYPDQAWVKFQAACDPKGSVDKFIGVVDGRSDTPYAALISGSIERFKNVRFRISRRMEPYFSQGTKQEAIDFFKSERSNEFLQQVDAKDGEPVFGFWNIGDIASNFDQTEAVDKSGLLNAMQVLEFTPKEYDNHIPAELFYSLPRLPEDNLTTILAIDAGYTQPTMILPFFKWKGKWQLHMRIILRNKIIFDDQAEIIDYLADFFQAAYIPIDCSSAEGKAIASTLQNPKNKKYALKKYDDRIPWLEFQKDIVIGFKEDDETKKNVEMKVPAKIHTSNRLHRMFANRAFNIYSDEDMLLDFNKEYQKTTPAGHSVIYTPYNVHTPEAFRCFAYAVWQMEGGSPVPPDPSITEDNADSWGVDEGDLDFGLFGRQIRKPRLSI